LMEDLTVSAPISAVTDSATEGCSACESLTINFPWFEVTLAGVWLKMDNTLRVFQEDVLTRA
jgi:hypothetical protein